MVAPVPLGTTRASFLPSPPALRTWSRPAGTGIRGLLKAPRPFPYFPRPVRPSSCSGRGPCRGGHGGREHLPLRAQPHRIRPPGPGRRRLLPDAHGPRARRRLLPAQRPPGRGGRTRGPPARPRHALRGAAGHADRPLRHHVPAGEPGAAVPGARRAAAGQHGPGRGQPLDAPAQLRAAGQQQPQERGPDGEPGAAAVLHLAALPLPHVRRQRALLLPALPAALHRGAHSAARTPGSVPRRALALGPRGAAEDAHQRGSPRLGLPRSGRHRPRRAPRALPLVPGLGPGCAGQGLPPASCLRPPVSHNALQHCPVSRHLVPSSFSPRSWVGYGQPYLF